MAEEDITTRAEEPMSGPDEAWPVSDAHGGTTDAAEDWDDDYDDEPEPPRDTVVSAMLAIVFALIVVLLAVSVSMVAYLLSLRHAPRTYAELRITQAESLARTDPGSSDNWIALAYAYAQAGRYQDALSVISKGRAVGKEKLDLVNADVLRMMGRLPESEAMYTRAIAYLEQQDHLLYLAQARKGIFANMPDPFRGMAYYGRGMAEYQLGQYKDAVKDLKVANAVTPIDVTIMTALAQAYLKLNDVKSAKLWYKRAVTMSPDYAPAVQGLKDLQGR